MRKVLTALAAIAAGISVAPPVSAEYLYLRGKVEKDDGSPPGRLVSIEQVCVGNSPKIVATAGKTGEFLWRAEGDSLGLDVLKVAGPHFAMLGVGQCVLRAELSGYHSSTLDLTDRTLLKGPQLPLLVLTPKRPGMDLESDSSMAIPGSVRKTWALAEEAMSAANWPEAERQLRAVTAAEPKFRPGWLALGLAYHNQRRATESRDAYRRAVALDPKPLQTQLMLVRANLDCQDWAEASRGAAAVIAADAKHSYLEAYLDDAIALYHLREMERAEGRLNDLLPLDKAHRFPRAEYVLGLILERRRDFDSARQHMARYLELQPRASDAPAARTRIENLGKPQAAAAGEEIDAPNLTASDPGEAAVPGGLKAFVAIAHLENQPAYDSFFLDYCRRLLRENSLRTGDDRIPAYSAQLQAYMAAVDELTAAGRKRADDSVLVTLSLKNADERTKTARLLRRLGWMLDETGQSPKLELGGQPADGLRHGIPAALGIDEIAMREALEAGREFEFEIRSDNARLIGGIRWAAVLKGLPPFPGGMADVFSRDLRFAKAYAGLGAMSVDTALGLISAVGVRDLVTRYADVLELCSGALTESSGRVSMPGGKEALPVWAKLAGADPAQPVGFFRALLAKDGGRLAVFYSALAQVDESRQRYFTANASRAQRYYEWYRDSSDMRTIESSRMPNRWRGDLFGKLPLDEGGRLRFPGGRAAWSGSSGPDDEALLRSEWLQAFVPLASLETKRGAPLDAASAALLVRHYAEWRSLFPYFENLPALGGPGFQALADFAKAALDQPSVARNILVGEWHSLVKLIVLGAQAGSLDQAAAARAFARVCTVLAGPDPSPNALAALREIAGGQGSLDEALATRLLRLEGPRRASFDRVRDLQSAPRLDAALAAATPAVVLAALSGVAYAAVFQPNCLLIAEDPGVLSRHRFVPSVDPKVRSVFLPTDLVRTTKGSPSYMTGGFMTLEEIARSLARHKGPLESDAGPVAAGAPGRPVPLGGAAMPASEAVFRATGRLVEVHATVTDGRGRYSDDVSRTEFVLRSDGKPVPVVSFENQSSAVSVALLFDATGSMQNALPPLKSAALKLIGEMRPTDAVAVYSFNLTVTELQPFTTDKAAAARAILRARAGGATALYDALVRVNRDLAGRTGKKAIVVFTDGSDNQSVLTAQIAIARARAAAAPIYTIAQGSALRDSELLDQLAGISRSTGGLPFAIHEPAEILNVFESVSRDLTHGYLLTFQQPPGESAGWHSIKVTLAAPRGRAVRAREGYSLE